jgi:predicted metal-dependent hydrolase
MTAAPQLLPRPRALAPEFDDAIPRHWFAGNALATHLANGVNLLFPAGERFFIRSVHHYLAEIKDPVLRAQIQGFFGQEGRHAQAHARFFEVMQAQGYKIDGFLRLYEALCYRVIERLAPPPLRLAATAACEHFTAILAEGALRERILDLAHPTLRELLLWHAAEEIEHKTVAFDVLQQVAPSYALRVAGLVVAAICLSGFWCAATAMLLWQDRHIGAAKLAADRQRIRERRGVLGRVFGRGIRQYLRRDFHPSQNDDAALAADYLASIGAEPAQVVAAP